MYPAVACVLSVKLIWPNAAPSEGDAWPRAKVRTPVELPLPELPSARTLVVAELELVPTNNRPELSWRATSLELPEMLKVCAAAA